LPVVPTPISADKHLSLGGVAVTRDGRTVTVVVVCGGKLQVREGQAVLLTWVAGAVGAGAMSCALVPLTVRLRRPLGLRPLVDAVSGRRLRPAVCDASGRAIFQATCR
jgi:hypothetical protein